MKTQLPYLEGPEQVDLDDAAKLVEQGTDLVLAGRSQHLGEEQLHNDNNKGRGRTHMSAAWPQQALHVQQTHKYGGTVALFVPNANLKASLQTVLTLSG